MRTTVRVARCCAPAPPRWFFSGACGSSTPFHARRCTLAGEIAGLFAKDELDAIMNDIRPVMKAELGNSECGLPGHACMG